jgi:hypothetical protein
MCDNSTKAERERLRGNAQAFMAMNNDNIRLNNANMGLKVRICKQKIDNPATKISEGPTKLNILPPIL